MFDQALIAAMSPVVPIRAMARLIVRRSTGEPDSERGARCNIIGSARERNGSMSVANATSVMRSVARSAIGPNHSAAIRSHGPSQGPFRRYRARKSRKCLSRNPRRSATSMRSKCFPPNSRGTSGASGREPSKISGVTSETSEISTRQISAILTSSLRDINVVRRFMLYWPIRALSFKSAAPWRLVSGK